jgi:hypothetical protein
MAKFGLVRRRAKCLIQMPMTNLMYHIDWYHTLPGRLARKSGLISQRRAHTSLGCHLLHYQKGIPYKRLIGSILLSGVLLVS